MGLTLWERPFLIALIPLVVASCGSSSDGAESNASDSANNPPLAVDDNVNVDENTLVLIDVLGKDNRSQVTDTPSGNDFYQVAAGGFHSVALKF
jgi:hypothetical protein